MICWRLWPRDRWQLLQLLWHNRVRLRLRRRGQRSRCRRQTRRDNWRLLHRGKFAKRARAGLRIPNVRAIHRCARRRRTQRHRRLITRWILVWCRKHVARRVQVRCREHVGRGPRLPERVLISRPAGALAAGRPERDTVRTILVRVERHRPPFLRGAGIELCRGVRRPRIVWNGMPLDQLPVAEPQPRPEVSVWMNRRQIGLRAVEVRPPLAERCS